MSSFPQMRDLPPALVADGWEWQEFHTPFIPSQSFWLSTNSEGCTWLTKLSGSYHAYREIVFARIAQTLGWSCQSSIFLQLSKREAQLLGTDHREVHAGHWFFSEHPHAVACGPECPLLAHLAPVSESVEELERLPVEHGVDLARGHFASCIFGANEAPQQLITTDHQMVLIDNETMFQSMPCTLDGTNYWKSAAGKRLARDVCTQIASIPDPILREALETPKGLQIRRRSEIAPRLRAGRDFAKQFARTTL